MRRRSEGGDISSGRPASGVALFSISLSKLFASMALRLLYPFLGDVSRGLGITEARAGRLLGLGELAALSSLGVGRHLDRGHHRRWLIAGAVFGGAGALVFAVVRTPLALVVGFSLLTIGVAVSTGAGHALIGERVPFASRGRVIGLYETSWAVALLVGGPLFGFLIKRYSWSMPFVLSGIALLFSGPLISVRMARRRAASVVDGEPELQPPAVAGLSRRAVVLAVATSVFLTLGAVLTFSSFGPWLEERHGLSTKGIGLIAMVLGAAELAGSGSLALWGDRLGIRRSVVAGALCMAGAAIVLLSFGNDSKWVAFGGIVALFGAFEFAFVAQLALISEVGGAKRGQVVAIDHALVVVMRAGGAALGPALAGESSSGFVSAQALVATLAVLAAVSALLGAKSWE